MENNETQQQIDRAPAAAGAMYRVEVIAQQNGSLAPPAGWEVEGLHSVRFHRLYFLQGELSSADVGYLAQELLVDPVTETASIKDQAAAGQQLSLLPDTHVIDVTFLPGVTDPPAGNLVRAAHLLGVRGLQQAATGRRYYLNGRLNREALAGLATRELANPIIQRFSVDQPITAPFFPYEAADSLVESIPIRELNGDELLELSRQRRLALDAAEMAAIQSWYRVEGRDPTDVELETLAQTWSEHCVHKTFKAMIDYFGPPPGANAFDNVQAQQVDGLLNSYIRAATERVNKPWVRSAFVDNAGIVAFDDYFDLAFKVETHNHPSALEPFGGANTGVGGVVRDVLGVSARPIANTDVLCFGPLDLPVESLPAGTLHPQRIATGVMDGIEDYGNKMGIPTVNGAIFHHPGYTANPLVYCGCVGILPRGAHATTAQAGDLIIAIGGRTGRDGLRGATFSSMEMDITTNTTAGSAVQIGNPIQEKQLLEVVLRARDEKLYNAITDCGAGGFSSAVGEMGAALGARVQLQNATLKYPGLRPWEIWLSEAQERMVLAVPAANLQRLEAICALHDVELVVLGTFETGGRLQIEHGARLVGDLSMEFLHDGLPRRHLQAEWRPPEIKDQRREIRESEINLSQSSILQQAQDRFSNPQSSPPQQALLSLLAHPNIRSKEAIIRRYDHEVQGGTAVRPLVGVGNCGPGDAAVIVPLDTLLGSGGWPVTGGQWQVAAGGWPSAVDGQRLKGIAIANGICPQYGELDPYAMAWAAVDEAFRNLVAVGADPDTVSLLDNFCWGNPNLPDRLGSLVRCAQGCYDAAVAYEAPFVSGKDSLNNEYSGEDGRKHAIPGTLLISALGIVPAIDHAVTMDLKRPGDFLFIVGETRPELGGSHFELVGGRVRPQHQSPPRPAEAPIERLRALHRAMQAGLVRACHDCSEGGLAVAVAEMCLAGDVGVEVTLAAAPIDPHFAYAADDAILFAESLTRFLVEVAPEDAEAFIAIMGDIPHACIGVSGGRSLRIMGRFAGEAPLLTIPVTQLRQAWRDGLPAISPSPAPVSQTVTPAPTVNAGTPRRPPRVLILHANGTNRDREAALACQLAGGAPEIMTVNQLLAGERELLDYHMLVVPGGFSYGDDLGAGILWAGDLRHRLGAALQRFVDDGRPVLGICNGFQALVKAGLLPGADAPALAASRNRGVTLTANASGHFECRWVYLQPDPAGPSLFTRDLNELIYCPVAHGEGRLAVSDEATAAALQDARLIPLTYTTVDGSPPAYPANPNGSVLNIAGLCNATGNVLGLMPHPEDHIFAWQHPRQPGNRPVMSGLRLFENGVKAA